MSKKSKNTENQPLENPQAVTPPAGSKHSLRNFLRFILALVLVCGIFILVTNGIYYWLSKPMTEQFAAGQALLETGVPADAENEKARLAYYVSCADRLTGLPEQLDALNQQPWTFAVLIRESSGQGDIPAMLDTIKRGKAAVGAYFNAIDKIRAQVAAYQTLAAAAGDPAAQGLSARLAGYSDQIDAAAEAENLHNALADIKDLDLAGRQFSRAELGLDQIAAEVEPLWQPIAGLQALLSQSGELETQLDELYAIDPTPDRVTEVNATLEQLLADQEDLAAAAENLRDSLPDPLAADFAEWQDGLAGRTDFIKAMQTWWENRLLAISSINSATIDRDTANRYRADSLAETNVDTAYLWTQTAEDYERKMATAIDFTNIYNDRANQQLSIMSSSRQTYRPALGLDIAERLIEAMATIDSEAFKLAG